MRDPEDVWQDERQATGPTPDQIWANEQRRTAAAARAQATRDCQLCDPDGYRDTQVCDHQDHRQSARNGMDEIRRAMGWPNTKNLSDQKPLPGTSYPEPPKSRSESD